MLAALQRAPLAAGLIAAAVTAGLGVSRLNLSRDGLVLGAIGALLVMPIVIRFLQRRFDPFEPIVIFVVAFGAMFFIRPLAMLAEGSFVYERSSRTISVQDTFSEMMVLAAAGAAAFIGAYALPHGRRVAAALKVPNKSFHIGRILWGAVATAVVGVILSVLFLAEARVSLDLILAGRSPRLTEAYRSSSAYLAQGPYLLASSALILLAAGRTYARKGFVILAGIIALVVLFLSVPTGSRMLLLPFIGGAVVYHYVSRRTRPGIFALIGLLVISCFVSKLLLDSRNGDQGHSEAARSILQHPERMLDPLTRSSDAEMAAALAVALKVIPEEMEFMRGGATVGDFVRRPMPRELWREKPLSPRETLISRLWPTEYRHGVANPEFSVLLYFYLDFALLGVIVGMALYGVIARVIYEYFRLHGDSLVVRLVFSLSVPFIAIALRDSPVDTFMRAAFVIVPVVVVFGFAAKRDQRLVPRGLSAG
ncbi:MAG TPA: O-antigen polymerase [Gemmatimonadaceae bacterium]|nr:O-antigen polymerase [Gemmatimonadaceae bacterium]